MTRSNQSKTTKSHNGPRAAKPKLHLINETQENYLARARMSKELEAELNTLHKQFPNMVIKEIVIYHDTEVEQASLFT